MGSLKRLNQLFGREGRVNFKRLGIPQSSQLFRREGCFNLVLLRREGCFNLVFLRREGRMNSKWLGIPQVPT